MCVCVCIHGQRERERFEPRFKRVFIFMSHLFGIIKKINQRKACTHQKHSEKCFFIMRIIISDVEFMLKCHCLLMTNMAEWF